ncbi:MAG: hypothetical protein ABL308_04145 [Oceanicaulis sp.]
MLSLLAAALQAATPGLDYTIAITASPDAPAAVTMTLQFSGDADGMTELVLPTSWGGEDDLWRGIEDLAVEGGTLAAADPAAPGRRAVSHAPGAPLTVTWRVIQDRDGEPAAEPDDNYRPWVRPGYVHMIGHTALIRPDAPGDTPVSVRFETPEEWALASDLEHEGLTLADVGPSVIAAGDFTVRAIDIDGAQVRVAVRGQMDADLIAAATEAAVRSNLLYFDDRAEPYLVTGLPVAAAPGMSSFGGTNLDDAFALFGTANTPPDILQRILVHEHAHTWLPLRLGGLPQGANEPYGYWFSEGFTDFVTTRAGLLGGAWDAAAAIGHWNEFLAEYMSSPVRTAPNAAIAEGFWTDFDLQRLPYLRGKLFAALVEHRVRQATNGGMDLDDVLAAMYQNPAEPSAPEGFVAAVRTATGVDVADLYQRHIVQGETIVLHPDTFGACGVVETGLEPVFVYGMTLAPREDGGEGFLIAEVDPEGPAAGVFEPGMILLERVAGAVGDATQPSAFRILDGQEEVVLSYLPTTGETAPVQRLTPADGAASDPVCFAILAGRARP